jgi:uncharacterized protein
VQAESHTLDRDRDPKLGDEWRNWDGRGSSESAAPKRLFFALTWALLALAAASSWLMWYMVAPRLAEWHRAAPTCLFVGLAALVAGYGVALALVTLMLLTGWPRTPRACLVARRVVAFVDRGVFRLGRLLSVDRDRLAHAFIRTNNAFVRMGPHRVTPEQVLLLLPRCLRKEQLDHARSLARTRGIETAVVGGGEQARQRISEKRPTLVVGVACERDLLSGIRDLGRSVTVLGIANRRPDGPCRNTQIDLDELETALELCTCPSSSAPSTAGT